MNEKTVIMSRKQAIAAGIKKFYNGKPCVNGHLAMRYTQSGSCEHCINPPRSEAAKAHDEKRRAERRELLLTQSMSFNYCVVFSPAALIPKVREFAISLGTMTAPGIQDDFIFPMQQARKPRGGGGDYKFRVHYALLDTFQKTVAAMVAEFQQVKDDFVPTEYAPDGRPRMNAPVPKAIEAPPSEEARARAHAGLVAFFKGGDNAN